MNYLREMFPNCSIFFPVKLVGHTAQAIHRIHSQEVTLIVKVSALAFYIFLLHYLTPLNIVFRNIIFADETVSNLFSSLFSMTNNNLLATPANTVGDIKKNTPVYESDGPEKIIRSSFDFHSE